MLPTLRRLLLLASILAAALVGAAGPTAAQPGDDPLVELTNGFSQVSAGLDEGARLDLAVGELVTVEASTATGSARIDTTVETDTGDAAGDTMTVTINGTLDLSGIDVLDGQTGRVQITLGGSGALVPQRLQGTYSLLTQGPSCAQLSVDLQTISTSDLVCDGDDIRNRQVDEQAEGGGFQLIVLSANASPRDDGAVTALVEFELVMTFGQEACDIVGTDGNDELNGGPGNEVICGLGGDDEIDGGAGDDVLVGGPGADGLVGRDGDDTLLGGPGRDALAGEAGADLVLGGPGNDRMFGSDGVDTMFGCSGFDLIVGGDDGDVLGDQPPFPDSATAIGPVTVADVGCDLAETEEFAGDSIFGGRGDDTITGGGSRDEIYGGSDADTIDGGGARDLVVGCGGVDDLDGGPGNDTMLAEAVLDDVDVAESNRIRLQQVDCSPLTPGASSNTMAGGSGDDEITGGDDRDVITGGRGSDKLRGLGGPDRLAGNQGFDIHLGGGGRDTILANDGTRDRVDGGPGRDGATVDTADQVARIEIDLTP